jgi:hypothetical protein
MPSSPFGPEHDMPWHGMDIHLLSLSLINSNVSNRVIPLLLTPLSLLDTLLDQTVHRTRQNTQRPDVPRRAHARQSVHGERHGHAQTRHRPASSVDPLRSPRITCSPTSPATARTRPLARAAPVDDDINDALRRGTASSRHAPVLALASFSPQSRPASPP